MNMQGNFKTLVLWVYPHRVSRYYTGPGPNGPSSSLENLFVSVLVFKLLRNISALIKITICHSGFEHEPSAGELIGRDEKGCKMDVDRRRHVDHRPGRRRQVEKGRLTLTTRKRQDLQKSALNMVDIDH